MARMSNSRHVSGGIAATPTSKETELQRIEWERRWAEQMVDIWKEKLLHYRIRHTGALYNSIAATDYGGAARVISHRFLEYGLYVAAGTGKYYDRDNGGELAFFQQRGKGKTRDGHRQRRPWFRPRYMASLRKLNEMEARFYGEAYQGMLADVIRQMFEKK